MGKINVLSFAVANLIAAGEVVDRPSSVIKELTENSIDSGATRITVEIQNGGVTFMRVTDNGCGIERDDLPMAVRRHATSKIKNENDLAAIMTLGFRGEALAAIAAVSDLRIISRSEGSEGGASIEVSGGTVLGVNDHPCQKGTTVIVENLFANVPARRKFLKKDVTEAMAVTAVVEKIALSHPEIAFRLIIDGNPKFDTVGDGKLISAIHAVFGRDFARALIEVNEKSEGIGISGYIGRSDNCKVNRNYQNFFINNRYVKSRTAQAAIEQAYVSYLPPDKFPVCVLNIEINPMLVDVNVHPAKLEVKFSNEKPVFEAIYYSVRAALSRNVTRPEINTDRAVQQPTGVPPVQPTAVRAASGNSARLSDSTMPIREGREESLSRRQMALDIQTPKPAPEPEMALTAEQYVQGYVDGHCRNKVEGKTLGSEQNSAPVWNKTPPAPTAPSVPVPPPPPASPRYEAPRYETPRYAPTPSPLPAPQVPTESVRIIGADEKRTDWRMIGEAFNSYIFVERGDRVIVIDKHAAHERIIFERLKKNMKSREIVSQILMLPVEVMMRSDETEVLERYRREVEATGFSFETGRNTVTVTALPDGVEPGAAADMLSEMADRLLHDTGNAELTREIVFEKALYQGACKAAIKAGREYPKGYSERVVAELMALPDITFCPHGRPVAMEMTKRAFDRQFKRE
ncbi:MAG: DNA mismatch repair endonuclease MutL [Clostridia bacterium]|nr:DNA mismatch repair endonuclease MutL [Clostridia bacterium]